MDESPSILVYLLFHFRFSHVSKKNSDSVDRTLLKQSDDASNIFTLLREIIEDLKQKLEDETSARKKLGSDFLAYKSQTNEKIVQLEKQNDELKRLLKSSSNLSKPIMVDSATQMSNPSSPTPKRFVSFAINKTKHAFCSYAASTSYLDQITERF